MGRLVIGWCCILLSVMMPMRVRGEGETVTRAVLTWYGEGFLGRRHAASWHGETPIGAPETLNETYLGIAAPARFPFGAILTLTRIDTCWGEHSDKDGMSVVAVVIDRRARDTDNHFDAWPATARALGFGPRYSEDDGCVVVSVREGEINGGEQPYVIY